MAVAIALRSAAQIVAIGLKNQVVTSLTPELVKIELNGVGLHLAPVAIPASTRGERPAGFWHRCARARDCLECEFLYLHVQTHKRPLLVETAIDYSRSPKNCSARAIYVTRRTSRRCCSPRGERQPDRRTGRR